MHKGLQADTRVSPLAKWVLIILSSLVVSFFIVTGLASAKYAHTALPNTILLGKNISGYNQAKAAAYYLEHPPYVSGTIKFQIENDIINIKPEAIGITVDTQSSIDKALDYGKVKGIVTPEGLLAILGHKTVVFPEYNVNQEQFQAGLKEQLSQYEIPPTNAEITIVDNVVTIKPESVGKGINYAKAHDTLSQYIKSPNIPVIPVEIITQTATITAASLEPMKQYLATSISGPVDFYSNSRKIASADIGTIVSWLDQAALKDNSIVINQDALNAWLGKNVIAKVEVKAKPKLVSSTDANNVLDEGRVGKAVNDTAVANDLITIIKTNPANRQLIVATTDIEPEVKAVTPNTGTGGMYPGRYIEVNLSQQMLYQYDGETLVGSHRVSTGKWSMPTPTGTFSINNKNLRAYSSTYNLYMPYWMSFIGSSYGIHELPEWANGTKEGESHLGTPVSHGCIRLGVGSAAAVYDWAEVGTPVIIHD